METTFGYQNFLAMPGYVGNQFIGVFVDNTGTHWHTNHQILTCPTSTVTPHATLTGLCPITALKTKVDQCIQV